jgi:hypothetical protein
MFRINNPGAGREAALCDGELRPLPLLTLPKHRGTLGAEVRLPELLESYANCVGPI